MKVRLLTLLVILTIALAAINPAPAAAQSAYQVAFSTAVTYQNVDSAVTTSLEFWFYDSPTATTPIIIAPGQLAAGASNSLQIGSLAQISAGFQGSAIVQSDKLLVATLVQLPQQTAVRVRPLSNGFSSGSSVMLLATVLKNEFNSNSVFSVQNTDSVDNDIVISFYNTSAVKVHTITQTIAPGASFYVDAASVAGLGVKFNGSAVVQATKVGGGGGSIVGSVLELSTNDGKARAFESVAQGARTIFLASALCNAYPDPVSGAVQTSNFAVQNSSLTTVTNVTITYKPGDKSQTVAIQPGSKATLNACNAGVGNGWFGSAIVTSDTTDVVAIGKIAGKGASTAYLGEANGAPKLALPYVRYTEICWGIQGGACGQNGRQRTTLAVQNIGDTDIPANSITVTYVDLAGATWTHTYNQVLKVGEKFNSNAGQAGSPEFGYVGTKFGGGATVTCTAPSCEIIAIARVATRFGTDNFGEDYNGLVIP